MIQDDFQLRGAGRFGQILPGWSSRFFHVEDRVSTRSITVLFIYHVRLGNFCEHKTGSNRSNQICETTYALFKPLVTQATIPDVFCCSTFQKIAATPWSLMGSTKVRMCACVTTLANIEAAYLTPTVHPSAPPILLWKNSFFFFFYSLLENVYVQQGTIPEIIFSSPFIIVCR